MVTTSPLQKLFFDYGDTASGDRWTGSDGAYSAKLPDGRIVWMWGDTFLGTVNADHSRNPQGFIHHAFTMMNADGTLGETIYKKNDGFGDRALIHTTDGQTYYWLGDGTVEGDKYRQFAYRIVGGVIVGVDVATFSLPAFTLDGVTAMPGAWIPGQGYPRQYGVSIVEEDDYTYIYGCETGGVLSKELHVARVPRGQLLSGTWEYWTGSGWSTLPLLSARIRSGVADEMSVVKTKTGYRAVASLVGIGSQIYMYTAPRPEGPWSAGTLLYTTPESNAKTITYNAKEHEHFAGTDHIVISYNVNVHTGDTTGLYEDVDNYRPRWIRVAIPSDLDVAPEPAATDDTYTVLQDSTLSVAAPGVLGNDTAGSGRTAALAAGPDHGSAVVQPDGSFSYSPADGFVGTDSFTYTLRDGAVARSGRVTVTVAPEALRDVECDDPSVHRTGQWRRVDDSAARGGRFCSVAAPTSPSSVRESRLTFTGDRVDVVYVTDPDAGRVTVLLDGQVVQTISEHGYVRSSTALRLRRLSAGPHTVVVRAEPGAGTGRAIATLDGFAVL